MKERRSEEVKEQRSEGVKERRSEGVKEESHLLELPLRVEELGDSSDQLGVHEESLSIPGGRQPQGELRRLLR